MSKRIIAGAGVVAGLAVALAPMATFAEETTNNTAGLHTLNVNVNSNCIINASDGAFDGAWSGEIENAMAGGPVSLTAADDADNQILFTCNENANVTVKAAATALTSTGKTPIEVTNVKAQYSAVGSTMTLESGWNSLKAFSGTTAETIATGIAPASGNFGISVTGYTVVVPAGQEAGNYTGTVTYTFDNIAAE